VTDTGLDMDVFDWHHYLSLSTPTSNRPYQDPQSYEYLPEPAPLVADRCTPEFALLVRADCFVPAVSVHRDPWYRQYCPHCLLWSV
jgi:hypothetical protein